jgi:two-component system OmpR family response regulator
LGRRRLKSPDGFIVDLSPTEFELLAAFAEHAQQVLSREQLLDLAHGRGAAPFDRTIDIQVSRLRRKIEPNPQRPQMITTVRGGGYLFTPSVFDAEASDS